MITEIHAGAASGAAQQGATIDRMATYIAGYIQTPADKKEISNQFIPPEILSQIGNVVCLNAAERLEASRALKVEYDLHLRNADLGASDAEIIARGIHQNYLNSGPALRTFSMSYNPGLTDSGVVALTRAFPSTLTELGLVECAIGDEGGAALLRWSKQANELRMICVEGNNFSSSIRLAFKALAQQRPSLLIVV